MKALKVLLLFRAHGMGQKGTKWRHLDFQRRAFFEFRGSYSWYVESSTKGGHSQEEENEVDHMRRHFEIPKFSN